MSQAARVLISSVASILVLLGGCVAAQWIWMATHHRYDRPQTGAYYGSLSGHFTGIYDKTYGFSFHGQTSVHWFWTSPAHFAYSSLQIDWFGEGSAGRATLYLPSLSYQSSNSAGVLTQAQLAQWLLGNTNTATAADFNAMRFLHGLLTAAGSGELLSPNLHGYSFQTPALGWIQHFEVGYGIAWPVYFWLAAWIALVWYSGRAIPKRHASKRSKRGDGPLVSVTNSSS